MTTIVHVERPCVLPAYSIPGVLPRSRGRRLLDELERARFWRERRRADEDVALCASLGALPAGSFAGLGPFWAAAFNPAAVAGCLRFGFVERAEDSASYPDLTGNGHDFVQANASNRPTFSATGLNGRPALVFDGSNDYMRCNTDLAAAVVSDNSPFSVLVVGQYSANTGVDSLMSFQHDSGSGSLTIGANAFVSPVGWRVVRTTDAGIEITRPNLGPVTTDPFIVAVVFDGSIVAVYRTGQLLGSGALAGAGTTTVNFVALGVLIGAVASNWTGVVAADAFYSRAITTAERQYLERGLGARYSIARAA